MARPDSPSALLRRLWQTTPLVRGSLALSVVLGICNVVLTIAQAVALAHALGSLFSNSGAQIRGDLILLAILALTRGMVSLASEPIASRLARPVRHVLRVRTLDAMLGKGRRSAPDAFVQLGTRGVDAIETYLATHNENPEPFTWTATTDQILEKIRRGRVTLQAITN